MAAAPQGRHSAQRAISLSPYPVRSGFCRSEDPQRVTDDKPESQLSQEFVDELHRAIAEAEVKRIWKIVEERNLPNPDEFTALLQSLKDESDRAVPIVLHSYLDATLQDLMEGQMSVEELGGALFDQNGPLSSSYSRIVLGQALSWLTPDVARELNVLRKIRNHFAHNPFADVNEDPVTSWIGELKGYTPQLDRLRQSFPADFRSEDNTEQVRMLIDDQEVWIPLKGRIKIILSVCWIYPLMVINTVISHALVQAGAHEKDLTERVVEALVSGGDDGAPDGITGFVESLPQYFAEAMVAEAHRLSAAD